MNTFTIYQNNTKLFNRCCDSPPSLEEKNIILFLLERCKFTNINYMVDVIKGNKHVKLEGVFGTSDEFIKYLEVLCEEKIYYGVELYLN